MRSRYYTAIGLFVVLAVAVAVPAVAVTDFGSTVVQEQPTDNESELGVAVTSFAQSSAVDAAGSAEQGLWQAQVNATFAQNATENETVAVISDRAMELEQRLAALQNRTERLEQNRANLSEAAYNARASALRSQIANVRSAIDQANRTAASRGVNTTQLDLLRTNAANMTGPEVAAIARNITDAPRGPPANTPGQNRSNQSSPGERGGQGNASADRPGVGGSGNNTMGPQNPGAGSGNSTAGSQNASDNGRPENAGDGSDQKPGDAGGSDNSTGPQSDEQRANSNDDDETTDGSDDQSDNGDSDSDDSGNPPDDRGQ